MLVIKSFKIENAFWRLHFKNDLTTIGRSKEVLWIPSILGGALDSQYNVLHFTVDACSECKWA